MPAAMKGKADKILMVALFSYVEGEMSQKRFRIQSVPTTILLDPEGKVVSAGRKGEPPLEGEKLAETLAKLFPKKGS